MTAIDVLRDEYPGDDAWQAFVALFQPAWKKWRDRESCVLSIGDEEIAMVLTASMGAHAVDWFVHPIGALGKRAPIEVLKNEVAGVNVIRTLLMRMPR